MISRCDGNLETTRKQSSVAAVEWIRRLKLIDTPAMTKDETSKYNLLTPDGKTLQFWSSDGSEASTQ
jgi:hypothetical protein